jgi:hypothetical protein
MQLCPLLQHMLLQQVLPGWHTVEPQENAPAATHCPLTQLPVLQQLPPHAFEPGGQHMLLPTQTPLQHWPAQIVCPDAQHWPLPAHVVPVFGGDGVKWQQWQQWQHGNSRVGPMSNCLHG